MSAMSMPASGSEEKRTKGALKRKPNIVYISGDDLGYGDVSCLSDSSKIKTKKTDSIAQRGMISTDAHSGSVDCNLMDISEFLPGHPIPLPTKKKKEKKEKKA